MMILALCLRHRQRLGEGAAEFCDDDPRYKVVLDVDTVKKISRPLMWVLLIFFVYALFRSPEQAANVVEAAWDGIVDGLRAIGDFFDALLD
ncbi:MAG: hypothetical protein ACRCTR_09435 [Actinomycetota bacterium]